MIYPCFIVDMFFQYICLLCVIVFFNLPKMSFLFDCVCDCMLFYFIFKSKDWLHSDKDAYGTFKITYIYLIHENAKSTSIDQVAVQKILMAISKFQLNSSDIPYITAIKFTIFWFTYHSPDVRCMYNVLCVLCSQNHLPIIHRVNLL